jgi:PleD family two-component response regulator
MRRAEIGRSIHPLRSLGSGYSPRHLSLRGSSRGGYTSNPVQPSILIVDDEPLIRWSLSERLAREGYRIVEAETAAQATDCARDGIEPNPS